MIDVIELSATALARAANVSVQMARRWKRRGRIPRGYRQLLELLLLGYLGAVSKDWRGWMLRGGKLWSPEDTGFSPGEIRAIPYREELIAELRRQLDNPRQGSLF